MKNTLPLLFATAAALCAQPASKLPKPFETPSAVNPPRVVARPEGSQLRTPPGFTIEEFATGFKRPRMMLLGPSKEILLTDSTQDGKVYILTNGGKDRKVLLEKLDRPYGIAFWKDWLYVAETTALKRYRYDAKAMTAGAGEMIADLKDYGKGHWTRSIAFDPKGEKLYLTVGSLSNVDAGEPEIRAAISVMNPDGSGRELFATGTRNPTDIGFYPGSNTLWAAVQERDLLGDDLVPDYFTSVQKGGFYGWPFAYVGPNEDPRHAGKQPELVKKTIVPDVLLPSHAAVLDFQFYQGRMFPAEYRGGAFLAYHGSWNRSKRVGYSVAFVPFQNGKPSGPPRDFLSGWMTDPDSKEVWGRPVGLLEMPDGSLLVSDDGGNKIWRIAYKR
ncbi:MAG: PQQ-dependent sugar dehydrogenase [Bryobacteraceae bacterium]|nr:PQQ-dependent sugar dehydrogenase [Bryobacteraceae bacterium]